ncbi:MAG: 30S ribosomal protein S4 [Clostridiales bacterium]|nr:30S ribosomal protein S4 [Clostridiales bacterium]
MARNTDPIAKRCRTLDISPAMMGYGNKKSNRNPGGMRRRKASEYSLQLKEKQKVKFVYGIMEKQFERYYEKAANMKGITGENLLSMLERRLDNVAYRLGFGTTRRHARQLVCHGHILVNGKRVDIPSYLVDIDDVITVRQKSTDNEHFKVLREEGNTLIPKWLSFEAAQLTGTVLALPARDDIDLPVQENLIVEFYSR